MIEKKLKIIVLDDDPTGCQTVYGCLVLTSWSSDLIESAFKDDVDFFYILTNTRAFNAREASETISEIVSNILAVNRKFGYRLQFISRSDSTLRSHFPLEIDIIKEKIESCLHVSTDAVFLVPAFIEGGRITIGDTHYVIKDCGMIPAAETEFAADSVYGYSSSDLSDYIEEKTGGSYPARNVESISLDELRSGDRTGLFERLIRLYECRFVVVNAENYTDLRVFSEEFLKAIKSGKNFLVQSAASVVRTLNMLPEKPLLSSEEISTGSRPGIILIGSYVRKTTDQYKKLASAKDTETFNIDTGYIQERSDDIVSEAVDFINRSINKGMTPVICTSRREKRFAKAEERLKFGKQLSQVLVDIVRNCSQEVGYIIAKGGITSADILTKALEICSVRVLGQLQKGVPVVRTPGNCRFPGIPYVIFPGNVGDDDALLSAYSLLSACQ